MELKPSTKSSSQKENFVFPSKRLLKNRNWTFPVVRYFSWKLEFFSNILAVVVAIGWKKKFVLLWKCIIFCNNLIRAKKCWWSIACKTTNKPCENLVRGRGWGETIGGAFLLTPWLIAIKYPKQITLCDTKTILLIIVTVIDT